MKILRFSNGQIGLLLVASVFLTSCNKEEYFPVEQLIEGADAYCSQALDLDSCHNLGNQCQGAFLDLEKDDQEPVFVMCIANPGYEGPVADAGTSTSTDGSATTGSSTDSSSGSTSDSSSGSTADSSSGSTTDSSSGSTADSSSGSTTDSSSGSSSGSVSDDVVVNYPTVDETIAADCKNLKDEHFLVTRLVSKKKNEVIKKVKVCHQTGNNSAHTIVIACPALKAHKKHHDDHIGACVYP